MWIGLFVLLSMLDNYILIFDFYWLDVFDLFMVWGGDVVEMRLENCSGYVYCVQKFFRVIKLNLIEENSNGKNFNCFNL